MNKAVIRIDGEEATFTLTERGRDNPFRTGSRGYHAQGKAEFGGKRYQCNILVVEIGSKNRPS